MYRLGGTENAMKRLYQSTIGGIINFSASAILPLSKANAGQLEAIQMKAARTILGVPKCVRNHIVRQELGLQPLVVKIAETATGQVLRTITTETKLRRKLQSKWNRNRWFKQPQDKSYVLSPLKQNLEKN